MKSRPAVLLLAMTATAVTAAEPMQLHVRVDAGCSISVMPGRLPLEKQLPGTQLTYKQSPDGSERSCEVVAPKAAFVETYGYCAMTSMLQASDCGLSYGYAGGRQVSFAVVARSPSDAAVCSYICTPREPP